MEKDDNKKRRKLREALDIGEKVLIIAKHLKKKDAPGAFYKSLTIFR